MPRVAFIGAGSTVFTRNLIGDWDGPLSAHERS
jgi:alpha-galactosidase/6-phospho-beta-glucosidase family protein